MATDTERKRREETEEAERERRRRQEEALDEALKETFPASDPVALEQPVPGS
jgi:nicotinate phosphoribosyltransferase